MHRYYFKIACLCFLLFSYGCREAQIEPFEEETGIFSVYGALNINEDRHIIRVRDLSSFHSDSSTKIIDAVVTFHDLQAGTSQMLRDSVAHFTAGFTHNFILEKNLKPRTTYKVTVEGSDGRIVSSTFTTPGITKVLALPLGTPVSCSANIQFEFENLLPNEIIRMEVGFPYRGSVHWFEVNLICAGVLYEESLQQLIVRTTPLFLLNEVFPSPHDSVFRDCNDAPSPAVRCRELDSEIAFIRHLHLGPEWNKVFPIYPDDPQDIEAIADGLGFLGAYYEATTTFNVVAD